MKKEKRTWKRKRVHKKLNVSGKEKKIYGKGNGTGKGCMEKNKGT